MNSQSAIAILYFNKTRLTEKCVESVLLAKYPPDLIYLFDNGSLPETTTVIRNKYPQSHHHRIDDNRGYAGGFNAALDWVFGDGRTSVFFLTNDTAATTGCLEACENRAQRTGAALVSPCITYLSRPDAIDSIGGFFRPSNASLNHYHETGLPSVLSAPWDYAPGTALWIHRRAYEAVGGMDESYHMYWDDVDFCVRAHQKGIRLVRCYDARIGHGVGQTAHKKPLYTTFYYQRNRIRFCKNHLSGDQRRTALETIQVDLDALKTRSVERKDTTRLDYLAKLQNELIP